MRNLHLFETEEEFDSAYNGPEYQRPWTSYIFENGRADYNKSPLQEPLTFEITSPGNIRWKAYNTAFTKTIQYKKNDGEWTTITSNTGNSAPTISVASGDTIQFRGDNATYTTYSGGWLYNSFSGSTCGFKAKGNIMSLINSTGFSAVKILESDYTFYYLFKYCTGLTDVNNLLFPATTLSKSCYEEMFTSCFSLIVGPSILPATTLAESCYYRMFYNCTGLTTLPELPATTLARNCYKEMFNVCKSLTSIPSNLLPATTLRQSCYQGMFDGCAGLTDISNLKLPATTLANYCYGDMFQNCTNITGTPELPASALVSDCYSSMFEGCSRLTTAPELPATILANRCYRFMFQYCTRLTTAPSLPATTLAEDCYNYMFSRCTSLTTAPALPATTLAQGCYSNMFDGCSSLNYIKCLATSKGAFHCTYSWVNNVASAGTFVKADGFSGWATGINDIPTNWRIMDESYAKNNEKRLTFNIISAGDIVWSHSGNNASSKSIEYKKNDGEWTIISSSSGSFAPSISVVSGDIVQFRGDRTSYIPLPTSTSIHSFSGTTCQFNLEGNIMSLSENEQFEKSNRVNSFGFYYLFQYCTGLTDITNLVLPVTNLTGASYCYDGMFHGCTSLTGAPANLLPAETLTGYCYVGMFAGCTSLATAPELPATTLANYCYNGMFDGCTSLTTAPELPATSLTRSCYSSMFAGCTSLTTAPALPATTLADYCYYGMFGGCTSLTTAPVLPATTMANCCYQSMFNGCTSLITAPELSATTLANQCYHGMFAGCTSLTTAPELPATTLVSECYQQMFRNCTNLNYIKCLATDISATSCTYYWVSGVASTGTFVKDASMSGWSTGNNGIPTNWTVQDA